jgi:hypothetical protein
MFAARPAFLNQLPKLAADTKAQRPSVSRNVKWLVGGIASNYRYLVMQSGQDQVFPDHPDVLAFISKDLRER